MDQFNPAQLTTLCLVFVGFHVLALPAFVWAMRRRQFAGHEQKEWNLDDGVAPDAPIAALPPAPITHQARLMLSILGVFAAGMIGSICLILYTALHAAAHPAQGKSPF